MLLQEFDKYGIVDFTPAEIRDTGADLHQIQRITICSLQDFRTEIRRRVGICPNGLNSGDHKSHGHSKGLAVDCFLFPEDGPINIQVIYKAAVLSGFTAIGIYWNQKQYSLHLEHRKTIARWIGIKDVSKGITDWQWFPLLNDPTKIKV